MLHASSPATAAAASVASAAARSSSARKSAVCARRPERAPGTCSSASPPSAPLLRRFTSRAWSRMILASPCPSSAPCPSRPPWPLLAERAWAWLSLSRSRSVAWASSSMPHSAMPASKHASPDRAYGARLLST
eukprot:scaffold86271_cov40-Phaeocystis_antarctica.AAC.2